MFGLKRVYHYGILSVVIAVIFGTVVFSLEAPVDITKTERTISPIITKATPTTISGTPGEGNALLEKFESTPITKTLDEDFNAQGLGLSKIKSAFAVISTTLTVASDEWDIPTSNSGPTKIMADFTNPVWFAEDSGNKIAKFQGI